MHGSNDEVRRLREELARLQRERGEAVGMVQILQGKLAEAEEDNFDLRANMMTVEAEIKYESKKCGEVMQKQVATLESKLSFLNEQLKNAERVKLRALRELEELQQKQMLEQKRLDAEKRLLATKKRKHESAVFAASQSIMTRMSQIEKPPALAVSPPSRSSASSVTVAEVQTDPPSPRECLAAENAQLLSTLMSTASRDLLVLFKGSSEASEDPTIDAKDGDPTRGQSDAHGSVSGSVSGENRGSQFHSATDSGISQSVFSQIAGNASAHVKASLLNFAKEINHTQAAYVNERAKDLHDVLATMIRGDDTAVALAPVVVRYLAAPTDLNTNVLCSVLRVLYVIIVHSECFQEFLLLASSAAASSTNVTSTHTSGTTSMQHPRISFPGLRFTSLDEYLASKKEDKLAFKDLLPSQDQEQQLSERIQVRSKLLSALCRVIQNNTNDSHVVESGLCVLSLWVDLGTTKHTMQTDFRALVSSHLIQEIVLSPKAVAVKHKAQALHILQDLIHFRDTFPEVEASVRRTLFFNRCAKMLGGSGPLVQTAHSAATTAWKAQEEAKQGIRKLQHMIVRLFLTIVITYPSTGIRFVLESTRGHTNEDDHDLSVIYYLAQLLHRETFDARTLGLDALDELLNDSTRLSLVQDAFTLLSLLVRYVDLSRELGGPQHEYSFLSVLYLLSSTKFDVPKNNTISRTAVALVTLMQPTPGTASSS